MIYESSFSQQSDQHALFLFYNFTKVKMSQFQLVTADKLENVEIIWKLCFLCQHVTEEITIAPVNRRGIKKRLIKIFVA